MNYLILSDEKEEKREKKKAKKERKEKEKFDEVILSNNPCLIFKN